MQQTALPTSAPRVTPLGRRMAAAHAVTLAGMVGTGPGGRVGQADVARLLSDRPRTSYWRPPTAPLGDAPTAWLMLEVDLTRRLGADGALTTEMLAALITSLRDVLTAHPWLAASWTVDGLLYSPSPVVAIHRAGMAALALAPADAGGVDSLAAALGTPVTSLPLGPAATLSLALGAEQTTLVQASLPAGQCAWLTLGWPQRRPTVVGDAIVPRWISRLALTFDHRVVDGGPAGAFLRAVMAAWQG